MNGSQSKSLLIRVDASIHMGTGHLMRCVALAQAFKARGWEVTFITACNNNYLLRRLSDESFHIIILERSYPDPSDWDNTLDVLTAHLGAWVVLDGYHFDAVYQRRIKDLNHRLLVIDDTAHLGHYYADVVLNQNIDAELLPYSGEPYTLFLLGTRYALLRSEFLAWGSWERKIPEVADKVLITLGGGDPDNQTLKVMRALQHLEVERLEARVVVGNSNPHFGELQSETRNSELPIRLVQNVNNMAELMAWADVAVSAGGSTCWEMAFMGLPSVMLVLAENQLGSAEGLDALNIALNLGWYDDISEMRLAQTLQTLMYDQARRKAMNQMGRKLVDGSGATYVVSAMGKLVGTIPAEGQLYVRPACFEDAELLWQWANDPTIRANSFHPQAIPLNEHIEWYKKKLTSPNTRMWILEFNKIPVAQIRYDRVDQNTAEISFSVLIDYRGRGFGTKSLVMTSGMACKELGVKHLKGVMFSSNKASLRVFTRAGFVCVGLKRVADRRPCHIFIKSCSEID